MFYGWLNRSEPASFVGGYRRIEWNCRTLPLSGLWSFLIKKVFSLPTCLESLPLPISKTISPIRNPLASTFTNTGHQKLLPDQTLPQAQDEHPAAYAVASEA
jgi:hypothetical protein